MDSWQEVSRNSLFDMVHSRDPEKRKKAALYMRSQEQLDEEGFPLLKRLIKDPYQDVSKEASYTLGALAAQNTDAFDHMMTLLDEELFWVHIRGVWALGECAKNDPKNLAYLENLATSNRKETVEHVIPVLGEIAKDNSEAYVIIKRLLRTDNEKIIEPVLLSIGGLGRENQEALKELRPYLASSNNFFRLWASKAVGKAACVSDEAFHLYRELSTADDVYVRRGFSWALPSMFKYRPKEAWKLYKKALLDSDRYVRTNAAKALGAAHGNEAFTRLLALLSHDKADIRRGAAEGILSMADKRSEDILPVLEKLAASEDYHLRSIAAFGSAKMVHIKPRSAVKIIKSLIGDKDEYVRRDAAIALGSFKNTVAEEVFEDLKALIEDRENIVRREAAKSLEIAVESKSQEILDLTSKLAEDMDEGVREAAASLLAQIAFSDPESVFQELKKIAKDDSPIVGEKAAKGLEYVFDLEPGMVIPRIWMLLLEDIKPEIFRTIGKLARSEEIGRVNLLYGSLTGNLNDSNMENCVTKAVVSLSDIITIAFSQEIRELYVTLRGGIRARTINDIALTKFDIQPLKAIQISVPSVDLNILSILGEISEMAVRYKQIEGLSDKRIYLGKILGVIDSSMENIAEDRLPELKITRQVLNVWRGIVSQTTEGLRGNARIKVSLRTKQLLPLDSITILLGVENEGESLAENLIIELAPSPMYRIVDKRREIAMLARESKDVAEFRIKPAKNEDFRVKFNITYDDLEMKGKSLYFADRVSFIDVSGEFKYIPNPYITGGPIKPSSKDMFFGRDDVFDFIRNNISSKAQKNVLIIQGERRTGKTSILYQVPEMLGPEYVCVFLDGQEFGKATLDYFFYRMARVISNTCAQHDIDVPSPPRSAFKKDPWYEFKDQFLEMVNRVLGQRYLVILFDEFESLEYAVSNGTLDPVIFGYIRNLMQHEDRLVFIFSGVHRLEEMMQDYWGVMFNIALYWKVSFLAESAARKLISTPVEGYNMVYDDLAMEKIIRATACHPYFVQLLCRFLINRHNTLKKNYITVQDVNVELDNVVEKAKPHFNYIWTLSSPYERLLLAILPEVLRKKKIARPIDILQELEKQHLEISEIKISSALKTLTARDILERASNGDVHYRFKVDFIRMWVEKHQSISRVLDALEEELASD